MEARRVDVGVKENGTAIYLHFDSHIRHDTERWNSVTNKIDSAMTKLISGLCKLVQPTSLKLDSFAVKNASLPGVNIHNV